MRVIIAGSRDLPNGMARVEKAIERAGFKITEVVSGNAPGVDRLGEFWAKTWNIPCTVMPADWEKHPKTAGTIRNTAMANYADALIAVWDGISPGTKNMIRQAREKGLKVFVDEPPKKVYHDDTVLPQNELSIDIETFSAVDLKKCGVHRYCMDPSFEVMLFQYAYGEDPVTVIDLTKGERIPDEVVQDLWNPEIIKNAFNAAFETTCLSVHFGRQMDVSQWRCTSVRALMHGLPNSLGEVCEVVGLPPEFIKDMRGHGLIRRFCVPCKPTKANGRRTRTTWKHEPESWETFKVYAGQDVVSERELKRRLLKHDQGMFEWNAWALDLAINDRGVRVDMQLVDNAIRISDAYREKLMTEARQLTGLSNPNSVKQLLEWFQQAMEEEQEELDPWASEEEYFRIVKLDKKTLPQILQNTQDETIRRVVRLRQELGRTSVAKYKAIKRAVCHDGRVHGMIQFYGANRTGRAAGRIVQMQNLRSNKLKDLALARELVRQGHGDLVEMFWGDVPDVLSQLIRTAFIPDEGDELTVVDEKAIEARVIAWLANEEWRLEVFRTHGMIYEASASQMFHIPMEEFLAYDRRGEKHPLRQKGKIAELALGFQGGPNALISMGALDQGLTEEELPEIVRLWRAANLGISAFPNWETGLGGGLWARFGDAAMKAVQNFSSVDVDVGPPGCGVKINFTRTKGYLKITLPSGRKLTYVKPRIEIDPVYGRPGVVFEGVNQETKKWGKIRTFGGKLCIAAGTLVLTREAGWIKIENISTKHALWDGNAWVPHSGLVHKGKKEVIEAYGALMTEDHEVLTEDGWKHAKESARFNRAACRLPDGYEMPGLRRKKNFVGDPLRGLWGAETAHWFRAEKDASKGRYSELRLHEEEQHRSEEPHARDVAPPRIRSVAVDAGPLSTPNAPSMEKLWCPGHQSLHSLGFVSGVLGGHGANVQNRANPGTQEQQWALQQGELLVGLDACTGEQQAPNLENRGNYFSSLGPGARNQLQHTLLPLDRGRTGRRLDSKTRLYSDVYDVLNCGPLKRFTIAAGGEPLIVHNCENVVQAIARDCLYYVLQKLKQMQLLFHVHDEAVMNSRKGGQDLETALEVMGEEIPWAPGLPLAGDGHVLPFYMKAD